ncbi:helix-turn-helix domain-containing protein [Isoptericola sp. NPDC019482]|uniref:helix-turn-helix domain-containing protein n=1 Tax=Isoptericola sp. NPDC019482 TaxID=3154688 RepID=UPI00349496AB
MNQTDSPAGHDRLPLAAVVAAAAIATALAYRGMVLFGLEVAGMVPAEAYMLAGFLEIALIAVALMARRAALNARPYGVLLTLTWILSGTSGTFAALHEVAVMNGSTPYMVVFRFVPPLVAALMWHLALVGERHLVTGNTLDERRRERRVHRFIVSAERWRDARRDDAGGRADARRVRAAHRRQQTARDRALKLLTVEEFDARTRAWVDRFEAAARHGERLDALGASAAARRGVRRGGRGGHDVDDAPTSPSALVETDEPAPGVEEEQQPAAASPDPLPVAVVQSAVPAPVAAAQQIARDEQATVILELHHEGLSERAIADRVPWSRSTVNRVLKKHGARSDAQTPSLLDEAVQA